MHLTAYLNYIIAGCQVIILNVQIINWFSKSRIAYVLAVFYWSQALGYITWINIRVGENGKKYLVCGILFAFVAIFDYFYFFYTPTQANIFIGESTRSQEERMKFDTFAQSANKNQMSVYHLAKQADKQDNRISLQEPFKYTDFILLLISASFKVAASRVNYDLNSLMSDYINSID
jgi:hypothetical protein